VLVNDIMVGASRVWLIFDLRQYILTVTRRSPVPKTSARDLHRDVVVVTDPGEATFRQPANDFQPSGADVQQAE
jgi:hypothetical protein